MIEKNEAASAASAEPCLPPNLRKPRLRRVEACAYLEAMHGIPIAVSTMCKFATLGGGPAYQKAGRVPLYTPASLDAWALARLGSLRRSTSDRGAA